MVETRAAEGAQAKWIVRVALIVFACLGGVASAQTPVPNLTRAQHALLRAIVLATDAAAAKPFDDDAPWQTHVMRASDGSHYVAFSLTPPPGHALPPGPVMLYLRLATALTMDRNDAWAKRRYVIPAAVTHDFPPAASASAPTAATVPGCDATASSSRASTAARYWARPGASRMAVRASPPAGELPRETPPWLNAPRPCGERRSCRREA